MDEKLAVVAIGGNSLIEDPNKPGVPHQWDAVRKTCRHIAGMIEQGWRVVIAHGNGPQVGFHLRRTELAAGEVHPVPLDMIVADTQGSIGYMLQQALENEFRQRGIDQHVVAIVTQVLVNRDDPAMLTPTKPIGGYLTPQQADSYRQDGWQVIDDAGRGLRRVVASPQPQSIVEAGVVRELLTAGFVVVAGGGGGIPVVENDQGELRGAYAVVDKDRTASQLATTLQADLFLISTGVARVALNFNTPQQRWLDRLTLAEARQYAAEGHFHVGSMLPKMEAVIAFLEMGGARALITSPGNIERALRGETGTWIIPGEEPAQSEIISGLRGKIG